MRGSSSRNKRPNIPLVTTTIVITIQIRLQVSSNENSMMAGDMANKLLQVVLPLIEGQGIVMSRGTRGDENEGLVWISKNCTYCIGA